MCRAYQNKGLGSTDLAYSRVLISFTLEFPVFLFFYTDAMFYMDVFIYQPNIFLKFVCVSSVLSYTPLSPSLKKG